MLNRFHLIPERHGQTDRRTDRQTELLYQYRASVCWRAMKIVSQLTTRSSAIAEKPRDVSCLSVVSFNIPTAQFLPCNAMHRAAIAGMRCLSVCLPVRMSICLSVTFVSCAKTNKDIFEIFSSSGSQAILFFPHQTGWQYSDGNPPDGASNARKYEKMTIFDQYLALSEKRLYMGTCSNTICKHRIIFPSIQHLAWLPKGRPQGKQKCGKNSDFWTYALTWA